MDMNALPVLVHTLRLIKPRLKVFYPVLESMHNYFVQRRINRRILNAVYQLIRDQGYYQNPATEITGTYELKSNERNILSLLLSNYAFSGGAHGLTINRSLTLSVETGQSYQLKDLFKPGADYVDRLSAIIKAQIAARDIPLLGEFNKIKPDQDYYIADRALVVYFQLYEITPYAYGFPYFPISVYEIQDIIDENGPLGVMLY